MMNFTELLTNIGTMTTATTADATTVNTKVTSELKKFQDANANFDVMRDALAKQNKITSEEAEKLLNGMGVQKVDITAKEAELRESIQAIEDAKAEDKFLKMAQKCMNLSAGLEAIAAQNQPAPQESDLDKLIKLQIAQLTAQQNQQQNGGNLGDVLGALIGAGVASAIINDATTEAPTSYATASKPQRPTNREQYEAHKEVTRSNSAKRGQLYADMKAGRITLSQYMAGCASTWSDAAAEHADITSRRRG
jgi:hypothetical protein